MFCFIKPIQSYYRSSYRYVSVTATMVKELREKSSAPMADCKKALVACDGNIQKAIDWLRSKGVSRATSASNRIASEGVIGINILKHKVSLAEVNSETDFVARNEEFQKFVSGIVSTISETNEKNIDVKGLLHQKYISPISSNASIATVEDALGDAVSKIRETLIIKRGLNIELPSTSNETSIIGTYVHGKVGIDILPAHIQMGRSAAVVALKITPKVEKDLDKLHDHARRLAMHIVAAKPQCLDVSDIPVELIEKEKAIFREQSEGIAGKSPEIIEKMILGKVNKRLAEITLLNQVHVAEEGGPVVKKHLDNISKQLGNEFKITIDSFHLWNLGQ